MCKERIEHNTNSRISDMNEWRSGLILLIAFLS